VHLIRGTLPRISHIKVIDAEIKASVRNDAKENVAFLEKQLITISDPLLREKLQALIADEIEKTMVVSKEAFRIVDSKYLQKKFKEKKLYPIVMGAEMFLITIVIIIFGHAFNSAEKTEEDNKLIKDIKKICLQLNNSTWVK
jgi:hypothetical protein